MLYLIGSVLLLSLNNLLWSHYAPKVHPFQLISRRALFTSLYTVIILIYSLFNEEVTFYSHIADLLTVSCIGFTGLFFLVLGFQHGTVLQFSVYSLLLAITLGLIGEQTVGLSLQNRLPQLGVLCFGYLLFVSSYVGPKKIKQSTLGHIYFILAHICFGTLLYFQWQLLTNVSNVAIAFFQELFVLALASIILLFIPTKDTEENTVSWWQYALFALPISLAMLLGLEGLRSTHPFHSALISLLTPVITVISAGFLGLEKLQWKPVLGFTIIVIGLLTFYL